MGQVVALGDGLVGDVDLVHAVEDAVQGVVVGGVGGEVHDDFAQGGDFHALGLAGGKVHPGDAPPPVGAGHVLVVVDKLGGGVRHDVLVGWAALGVHGEGVRGRPAGAAVPVLQRHDQAGVAGVRVDGLQVAAAEDDVAGVGGDDLGDAAVHREGAHRLGVEAVGDVEHGKPWLQYLEVVELELGRVLHRVDLGAVGADGHGLKGLHGFAGARLGGVEGHLAALDVDADDVLPQVAEDVDHPAIRGRGHDAGAEGAWNLAATHQFVAGHVDDLQVVGPGDRQQVFLAAGVGAVDLGAAGIDAVGAGHRRGAGQAHQGGHGDQRGGRRVDRALGWGDDGRHRNSLLRFNIVEGA